MSGLIEHDVEETIALSSNIIKNLKEALDQITFLADRLREMKTKLEEESG